MHVALLFPPGWRYLNQPFLSLPSLAAYLRERGVSVSQRDLNLEFMEYLSTEAGIAPIWQRVVARFTELETGSCLGAIEQRFYANLAWAALQSAQELAGEIRQARETIKGDGFYDVVRCVHAFQLLFLTWDLLWAIMGDPHDPAAAIGSYLEDSLAETMTVVRDDKRNPFVEYLREAAIPAVLAEKPDVIGVSVSVASQVIPALTLARLLREANTKPHIVLGGGICTRLAQVWRTHPEPFNYLDSVVLFEGERPLLRLVEALVTGKDLRGVPNLVYRQGNVIRSNPVESPEPINQLPTPDFDGLPLARYQTPELILPLLASRGCYWGKCTFCDFYRAYARYRRRDSRLVLGDIKKLVSKYGVKFVYFSDEAVAPAALREIAQGIGEAGLEIYWYALARFERQFTPELCHQLAQAGCLELDFGLESASERISRLMHKGVDNACALDVLRNVSQAGIVTRVNVIFGFPGETEEEAWETINFVLNNSDVIDAVVSQPFRLERQALISAEPEKYGVRIIPDARKNTALTHYEWVAECGFSAGDGAEFDRRFWREIGRHFPRFGVNYFPEVPLHYCRKSKQDLTRAVQASIDQYRRQSVASSPIAAHLDGRFKPCLRPGVLCCTLRFDLSKIDISINNGLVLFQNVKTAPPLAAGDVNVIIDVREPGRVLRVSHLAAEVLRRADGTRTLDDIAAIVADRLKLPAPQALRRCLGILKLHRALLVGIESGSASPCIPS